MSQILFHAPKFFLPLFAIVFVGSGCFGSVTKTAAGPDGGVFKTLDGNAWKQLKLWNQGTKFGSIANVGTTVAMVDPQDARTLYLGTTENGLMYSQDSGESWRLAEGASVGKVYGIAVDPTNKCVVYLAFNNRLFKTDNCLRDWNEKYKESRQEVKFTAIAVDWHNTNKVYLSTSDGDILQSLNGGESWKTVYRLDGVKINGLAIDPHDSRLVYAATNWYGLLKTKDAGATWEKVYDPFKAFEGSTRATAVVMDPQQTNTIYAVSRYGILQSNDAGVIWKALTLPSQPGSVEIKSFVIHPKDAKRLVYATDTALVYSKDGGQTWTSKKLPTIRKVTFLAFDNADTPALFLGTVPAAR